MDTNESPVSRINGLWDEVLTEVGKLVEERDTARRVLKQERQLHAGTDGLLAEANKRVQTERAIVGDLNRMLVKAREERDDRLTVGSSLLVMLAAWGVGMLMGYLSHLK